MTILSGDTVTFNCSFSGNPSPPTIEWFEGDSPDSPLSSPNYTVTISDDGLASELSFETSLSDHETAYYCRGEQQLVNGVEVLGRSETATLTIICEFHDKLCIIVLLVVCVC